MYCVALFTSELVLTNTFIPPYAFFHYRSGSVIPGIKLGKNVLSAVINPRSVKKLMRSQMVRALVDVTNTGRPAAIRSSTEVCGAVLRPSSLSEGRPDHEDNLLAEARDPLVKKPNILPRPATEAEKEADEESNNSDSNLQTQNVNLISRKQYKLQTSFSQMKDFSQYKGRYCC